jgi:uncharacterized protein YajQ (UPF0234 family)
MSDERMRILNMLAEGKITPDDAEKLLKAMDANTRQTETMNKPLFESVKGKYLYVQVEPKEGKSSERVSVKVPLALVKAGLNISKLIPKDAQEKVQSSMQEKGIPFNISDMDTENLQEILDAMEQMSIDVDTDESTVQVFCK